MTAQNNYRKILGYLTHPYTPLKRGLDSEQVGMTTKNDTNSYEYDANVNIALQSNYKKKGA